MGRWSAAGLYIRHGKTGTRLHNIWRQMRSRCLNKNHAAYERYGGKGIKICEAWGTFTTFEKWALANGYADNLSIDRYPNPSGNYAPNNCRWATAKEQRNNRS